ncbi:MAG: glycosyltransferase [Caldilineaceae bacterium]|nr:glycosyltransferase [Caldilineaceae bacterium]
MHVTVAIPCYNGAQYLDKTIRSVLAQQRPADKVLVVDDGSTDDSASIAARYPVRTISLPTNQGLSAVRNRAVAETEGDVLAFVDVDASADPAWLGTLLESYGEPGVSGAGGPGIESNIQSKVDRWRQLHATQGHGSQPLRKAPHLFGLNMSYRVGALRAVNGFDTNLRTNAEDMDVGYRLNDAGYRLVYRPDAIVYHQRQDDLASMEKTIYRWYYWAFVVKRKNGRNPWTLAAGTVRRLAWRDTAPDLLVRRDWELVKLDFRMAFAKLRGIRDASRAEL